MWFFTFIEEPLSYHDATILGRQGIFTNKNYFYDFFLWGPVRPFRPLHVNDLTAYKQLKYEFDFSL